MSGETEALDAVAIVGGVLGPLLGLVQQAIADGAKSEQEAMHVALQRLITDGHVEKTLPRVRAIISEATKRVASGEAP